MNIELFLTYLVFLTAGVGAHECVEDVHWDREDDSAVVLSRNAVESLEVSQLESCRIVHDHLSSVSRTEIRILFLKLSTFTSELGWPCVLPRQQSL